MCDCRVFSVGGIELMRWILTDFLQFYVETLDGCDSAGVYFTSQHEVLSLSTEMFVNDDYIF